FAHGSVSPTPSRQGRPPDRAPPPDRARPPDRAGLPTAPGLKTVPGLPRPEATHRKVDRRYVPGKWNGTSPNLPRDGTGPRNRAPPRRAPAALTDDTDRGSATARRPTCARREGGRRNRATAGLIDDTYQKGGAGRRPTWPGRVWDVAQPGPSRTGCRSACPGAAA